MMDLVKRNAEIVALVKARKMPMREIAARYRLSTSSISLIAIRHGVYAQSRAFLRTIQSPELATAFWPPPWGRETMSLLQGC